MALPTLEDYDRDFTTHELQKILRRERDVAIPTNTNKAARSQLALEWDKEHLDEAAAAYKDALAKAGVLKAKRLKKVRDQKRRREAGKAEKIEEEKIVVDHDNSDADRTTVGGSDDETSAGLEHDEDDQAGDIEDEEKMEAATTRDDTSAPSTQAPPPLQSTSTNSLETSPGEDIERVESRWQELSGAVTEANRVATELKALEWQAKDVYLGKRLE
jgi:hypothetical protein